MIKFVCASCGERLSVPDQHGGRKGVCPTCQAINRIPLKGFPETQPQTPVIARPDGALATQKREAPAGPASPPASARSPVLSTPPQRVVPEANPFELESTFDDSPASYAPIRVERRLPRKLKLTLLILAALGVVAALYFALLYALNTMLTRGES